jgi:signal transduction histidine kinase
MKDREFIPKALFDAKLLRQLLSNLLSNAIKYSPLGGFVNFSIILQPQPVIFQVSDRGLAIPEAEPTKVV